MINQSPHQSINEHINQSINSSINRLTHQSINRSIDQSTNSSINQSIKFFFFQAGLTYSCSPILSPPGPLALRDAPSATFTSGYRKPQFRWACLLRYKLHDPLTTHWTAWPGPSRPKRWHSRRQRSWPHPINISQLQPWQQLLRWALSMPGLPI